MAVIDGFGLMLAGFVLAAGFLFGIGRRIGQKEGEKAGLAAAPLQLRRQALEQGNCVLCGRGPQQTSAALRADGTEVDGDGAAIDSLAPARLVDDGFFEEPESPDGNC